mgnify:CR=1 FL=1
MVPDELVDEKPEADEETAPTLTPSRTAFEKALVTDDEAAVDEP